MSFLSRLLALVLVAVLVPIGLLVYIQVESTRQRQAEVHRDASFHAEALAAELTQLIQGIRETLIAVSAVPAVRRLDPLACHDYLSGIWKRGGETLLISALDERGMVLCAGAERLQKPVDEADRLYFQRARETGDFAVGEYTIDRLTGRRGIHLSYPIFADNKAFAGVVVARLSVDVVGDQLSTRPLPPQSSITVVDQHGTIIVDFPTRRRIGEVFDLNRLNAVSPATGETTSPFDAQRRIMGYSPAGVAPQGFIVAVGLARDVAFAELGRSTERVAALAVLGLVLALLAAWLAGRYGLQRPIFLLNDAARRWAAGDSSARTGLKGRSELDRLGQTFDRMAEALETRERERLVQEEELRRSRDEAVRANEAKSRFLAAASHDLRQPLQALSMGVTVLEERHRGDEHDLIMVGRVKRSMQTLTDLLNSLLDLAALEAGALTPQITEFSLLQVLQSLEDDFSARTLSKGLLFHVDSCDVTVRSDPQHLERLLHNLVDNAVKFTPSGGEVAIRCRSQKDTVEIEVADNGIGVSADQQRAIFQDFNQLNNPERNRTKGLGIGLAVVDRISKLLDHRVRIESEPSRGSRFIVEVPLAAPGESVLPMKAAGPVKGRVLLVEDDALVAEATLELLRSWGTRVEFARNAEEAMEIIARDGEGFEVVIADYRLPTASGLEVVANAIIRWPRIKAAIVTGDRASVSHEKIIASGVHLLEKPIRASQLAELLGAPVAERAG